MFERFPVFRVISVVRPDLGLGVEHHVAASHGRVGGLAMVVEVTVLGVGWTILSQDHHYNWGNIELLSILVTYNLQWLCQTFWVECCWNGGPNSGETEYWNKGWEWLKHFSRGEEGDYWPRREPAGSILTPPSVPAGPLVTKTWARHIVATQWTQDSMMPTVTTLYHYNHCTQFNLTSLKIYTFLYFYFQIKELNIKE